MLSYGHFVLHPPASVRTILCFMCVTNVEVRITAVYLLMCVCILCLMKQLILASLTWKVLWNRDREHHITVQDLLCISCTFPYWLWHKNQSSSKCWSHYDHSVAFNTNDGERLLLFKLSSNNDCTQIWHQTACLVNCFLQIFHWIGLLWKFSTLYGLFLK